MPQKSVRGENPGGPSFMYCVVCGSALEVIDSRPVKRGIRRRRRCPKECAERITTIEIPKEEYRRLVNGPAEWQLLKEKLRDVLRAIDLESVE